MRKTLRVHVVRVAVGVLMLAVPGSAAVSGQAKPKPAAVAGHYEGMLRGSSQGDAATTVTLVQDATTLTGTMDAGGYSFKIDGLVEGSGLSWNFSSGDITGSVSGTFKAGTITGTWNAMGSESGTIELKKSAAR
jgi:hypothetical protein